MIAEKAMDLSKLQIKPAKRSRAVDPREIFKSLTLRGTVENLWEPQSEALKEWHAHRLEKDTVVEMTTGGGKTLVGLLMGQSLANETRGKVLFVCATNQLVEQTVHRAQECGIQVASYMKGGWERKEVYDSCSGSCVTNYAALFNGKSIYQREELKGIIFDDAHVANKVIRGQFTLKVGRDHAAFAKIADAFRGHFARNNQLQEFTDAGNGNMLSLLFVPAFEVRRHAGLISKILLDAEVGGCVETMFAWVHLRDKLPYCTVLFSGSGVEIAPPVLPTFASPYLSGDVRRIYLTATLPSQIEFIRTFGMPGGKRVSPGGKSGEAQRQFIFVQGETVDEQRESALALIKKLKACVICPSTPAAESLPSEFTRFGGTHSEVEAFKKAPAPEKLVLIARYDGIDLPGDACRVLLLDGMPTGAALIERFVDQALRLEKLRSSHTATRVVQAIGRIFRSNTDHGAVLVCAPELQSWLRDPNNVQFMPKLLQQQIALGFELRRLVDEKKTTFTELLDGVLKGRPDWDELYSDFIEEFETGTKGSSPEWFVDMVQREREAFSRLWIGNGPLAAKLYGALAIDAADKDARLSAWYRHWEGLAHSVAGDEVAAAQAFVAAANERVELGRPNVKAGAIVSGADLEISPQAKRLAGLVSGGKGKLGGRVEKVVASLQYGPDTNPTEQALRDLGELLGLVSSRPDQEFDTGPDVMWRYPERKAGAILEAKTNKKATSQYQKKDDIGQFHDHVKWVHGEFPKEGVLSAIVGLKLEVSKEANPPDGLRIITLEQFIGLGNRLREGIRFIESVAHEEDLQVCCERAILEFGLAWPGCIESLESSLATDLKSPENLAASETD